MIQCIVVDVFVQPYIVMNQIKPDHTSAADPVTVITNGMEIKLSLGGDAGRRVLE
jgi:hypothetical protein